MKMDEVGQRLPGLTPEELANPYTRLSINGLEVQLWQVAHLYGVTHDIPGTIPKSGASARDFRALYSRQHDRRITSPSISASADAGFVPEKNQSGRETQDLLRLIDELIDEDWLDEREEQEIAPSGTDPSSGLASLRNHPVWADSSFPPPLSPPPSSPLPLLPKQAEGDRRRGDGPKEPSALLASTADSHQPINLPDNQELGRDADVESKRTITPAASRQQLVTKPQAQEASMPISRARAERLVSVHVGRGAAPQVAVAAQAREAPAPIPSGATNERPVQVQAGSRAAQKIPRVPGARDVSMPRPQLAGVERPDLKHGAGRAASTSILRSHAVDESHRRQRDAALADLRPKPSASTIPYSLPSFLQSPPSFLQHPPDFSQQPAHDQKAGVNTGGRHRSSSNLATPSSRPVTPTTDDDEVALTSRWSPESSPEESRLKKVKRVLSFAKLRSRKSSVFQRQQAGNQANESSASVRNRSSGSSGPRTSNSKAGN